MRPMFMTSLAILAWAVTLSTAAHSKADDVDSDKALRVDKWCKENPDKVRILDDDTYDQCRGGQLIIIDGRDGKVSLKNGETRYFAIPDNDDYGRSGGWHWHCNGSDDRSRLKGAKYIKVERDSTGQMHWVKIELMPI